MTMTTVSPSSSSPAAESTVHRKVKLVALLKECVVHLEKADNPPYTPLFHQALHALHEHAGNHIASLEHQINVLQQQKQKIINDVEVMKKSSVANSGQQGPATTKKEPSTSAAAGAAATATASANDKLLELERVKKAQAEKRRQEVLEQRRKDAEEQKKKEQEEKRKFLEYEARKQQFKWHPTAAATAATTTTKADSNTTKTTTETISTASSSESAQPREKKSDHSLQSRMKDEMSAAFDKDSNLNQKQKPQQHHHSQYPSTQKQQQPSPIPQQQTTYNVDTPKGQRSKISAQHNQQQSSNFTPRTFAATTTSPMPNTPASSSTGFQTPIQHPPQQQQQHVHTSNTMNSSSGHNSTPASWQSTQQQQQHQQQAGHLSPPYMSIPHLPKQAPPHPTRQQPHQAHPSATTSSQQQYHYHHPPTGSDRKYSQMSQHQRKAPQANQSSSNDANKDKESATSTKTPTSASPTSSPPPSSMTELKRNILLNWALQPPEYQILKPIPILVCTIQSVFPPAFGLNYHKYFDSWKHVTSTDLVVSSSTTAAADNDFGGECDSDKIKKIVRKLRFFLHPDKLPRDLSEQQIFCCQLLWDVTNDAYEDYKTSIEQLDWIHN